jgi:hypothetical protein
MKRLLTTLLFATGLLAVATISYAPAASFHAERTLKAECCADPFPVCPPFCDQIPDGTAAR